ncbi:MAG TPA: LysM domain-containing protein [Acidimicrobiales bacterium]|nr:LysM domain-containing protein [Acidimicrobiales bacterium]
MLCHEVKKFETLSQIARRYHVGVSDLMRVNQQIADRALRVGEVLDIPSQVEVADHLRQMRQEKNEAICSKSPTERHVFGISYDNLGRCNYETGDIVECEACGSFIKQDEARWVAIPVDKRFLLLPVLVIQEQDSIEDVL